MNKITFSALVLSALLSANVHANNTINFMGEVMDETCELFINGEPGNATIILPAVSASELASVGSVAGETPFKIQPYNCNSPELLGIAQARLVANNVTRLGNLGSTGSATNVALQLIGIVVPEPIDMSSGIAITGLETSGYFDFIVRYYAEGVVTSGSVIGSVQYAFTYP